MSVKIIVSFLVFNYLSLRSPPVNAIGRDYLTNLRQCTGSFGPTHGHVIKYYPEQSSSWYQPNPSLDCWVTFRGIPTEGNSSQYYNVISWQGVFSIVGHVYPSTTGLTTACATAYVEIYHATIDGKYSGAPVFGPSCGTSYPADYTTTQQTLVVHFYIEASPNVTLGVNDTSGGPFVRFKMTFTSYILDCLSDGKENDDDQLQCNNGRCVDYSLVCDIYGANNCADQTDQSTDPPAECEYDSNGDIIPKNRDEETLAEKLLPLWAILGGLAALVTLIWCCWRPGWFPWRLARLRNVACCQSTCGRCCRGRCCRSCGCCGGPVKGNCLKACRGCVRTKSGFPEKSPG